MKDKQTHCACGLELGINTGRPLVWVALSPRGHPLVVFANETAAREYTKKQTVMNEWTLECVPVLASVVHPTLYNFNYVTNWWVDKIDADSTFAIFYKVFGLDALDGYYQLANWTFTSKDDAENQGDRYFGWPSSTPAKMPPFKGVCYG